MATLYIEEYSQIMDDAHGRDAQVPAELIAKQKVTIGASSAQSAALSAGVTYVVVTADVPCQVEEASNPTASGTSRYLPADVPRAFQVTAGNKLAVIEQQ